LARRRLAHAENSENAYDYDCPLGLARWLGKKSIEKSIGKGAEKVGVFYYSGHRSSLSTGLAGIPGLPAFRPARTRGKRGSEGYKRGSKVFAEQAFRV
jgi:hypothetical protein